MKIKTFRLILYGLIVLIILLMVVGLYSTNIKNGIKEEFCLSKGYEYSSWEEKCYKIVGERYILKEIKIINGKAYWVVEE